MENVALTKRTPTDKLFLVKEVVTNGNQTHTKYSPSSSCFLFYQQINNYYKAHVILNCRQSKLLCCKNVLFRNLIRLGVWGFPRHRSATLKSNQCRHRNRFGCRPDNYQPRIPRAPCLCECCYSDPQYGGHGEDLETVNWQGT